MANENIKHISTRIKSKVATLEQWLGSSLVLLDGEIAIARIPLKDAQGNDVEILNPVTGLKEPRVGLLIKVGDGIHTFSELPEYLSAKAADVHDWAKTEDIKDVTVKPFIPAVGTPGEDGYKEATYGAAKELSKWLQDIQDLKTTQGAQDEAIAEHNRLILTFKDEDDVNNLIDAKLSNLDYNSADLQGNVVVNVAQVDGKIEVTKGTITVSNDAIEEVDAKKVLVTSEVGTKGEDGYLPAVYLDEKLDGIDEAISAANDRINDIIANGVDFKGITTTELFKPEKQTSDEITINDKTYKAQPGDLVICGTQEYIWTGEKWEPLGDLTRIGTIEKNLENLINTAAVLTGEESATQYVTGFKKNNNGELEAEVETLKASNVFYKQETMGTGDSATTVNIYVNDVIDNQTENLSKINNILTGIGESGQPATVSTAITTAIAGLGFTSGNTNTDVTTFIDSISLADGVVTYTTGSIPTANLNNPGIVKLSEATELAEGVLGNDTAATTSAVAAVKTAVGYINEDLSGVKDTYVRVAEVKDGGTVIGHKMYLGTTNAQEIIFDCGGHI